MTKIKNQEVVDLTRKEAQQNQPEALVEALLCIRQECATLPLLDKRTPEEIIGYNEHGVPA